MTEISGNTVLLLQTKQNSRNRIGEGEQIWTDAASLTGFLDLMNGSSGYSNFNAKLQESTHVFIADYAEITAKPEECRAVIGEDVYDVQLIDDPMGLHEHLEIFLRYVGGCHGTAYR